MSEREKTILSRLRKASQKNPVSRYELRDLTGLSDRNVREAIGDLRDKGFRIVGSAGTKGYYIARSEKQYAAFRAEYLKKAKTYMDRVEKMDNFVEGQVKM